MRTTFDRQRGFTFIEVMVSIGIFAVIATICFATLSQYLTVQDGVRAKREEMRGLQRLFTLVERDLRFTVNRPVRDENGEPEAAFLIDSIDRAGEILRVTVSEPDAVAPGRTRLRRIGWRLSDGELYRDSWQVLDRVQDSEPESRLVIDAVSSVELLLYQWKDDTGLQQQVDASIDSLPFGVEILVTMDNERRYRRVFDLVNGS